MVIQSIFSYDSSDSATLSGWKSLFDRMRTVRSERISEHPYLAAWIGEFRRTNHLRSELVGALVAWKGSALYRAHALDCGQDEANGIAAVVAELDGLLRSLDADQNHPQAA